MWESGAGQSESGGPRRNSFLAMTCIVTPQYHPFSHLHTEIRQVGVDETFQKSSVVRAEEI